MCCTEHLKVCFNISILIKHNRFGVAQMADNRFKFTLRRIEKIEPSAKRDRYYDTENAGLILEVQPSGRKVFRTFKRNSTSGNLNTVTIGPFPSVTVDMAIKRHSELVSDIYKGIDPTESKREAKRRGITFAALFDIYDKDFSAKVKRDERRASSQEHNGGLYSNHLSQVLDDKSRRLAVVTLEQINEKYASKIIETLKDEKTKPIFNKCLTMLKSMFNLAIKKHLITKNPFLGEKKYTDNERKRYLQEDEMERFFAAIDQEEEIYQDLVKMLLYTGQRKNCVLSMRWEELNNNLNVWTIPTSKMKGKESHTLPIPIQCTNILKRRAEHKHPNGFVFPAKTKNSKLGHIAEKTGENSFWRRITRNAGLYSTNKDQNLTVHDLRRSLASWQINNDVDLYTVSKTLGHKSITTTQKIYAHLNSDKVRDGVSTAASALELASVKNKHDSPFPKLKQLAESLNEEERSYLLGLLSAGN
jgi:integrase